MGNAANRITNAKKRSHRDHINTTQLSPWKSLSAKKSALPEFSLTSTCRRGGLMLDVKAV